MCNLPNHPAKITLQSAKPILVRAAENDRMEPIAEVVESQCTRTQHVNVLRRHKPCAATQKEVVVFGAARRDIGDVERLNSLYASSCHT